jgi:integrase
VRSGKGGKDRVTVLPENLVLPLQQQLAKVRALHQRDLDEGFGTVWLPHALAVKYPSAARALGWQWVFPSAKRSKDPRSDAIQRHHLSETSIQKTMNVAAKRAGIDKPCSPHILRHYLPNGTISGDAWTVTACREAISRRAASLPSSLHDIVCRPYSTGC